MIKDLEQIDRLTTDYVEAAGALGYSLAVVLIDPEQGTTSVSLNAANVSEVVVCAGVLLATIARDATPDCPHCANNQRRALRALRVMREHRTAPGPHHHGPLQ